MKSTTSGSLLVRSLPNVVEFLLPNFIINYSSFLSILLKINFDTFNFPTTLLLINLDNSGIFKTLKKFL